MAGLLEPRHPHVHTICNIPTQLMEAAVQKS